VEIIRLHFLKSKYLKHVSYNSFSILHGVKDAYDIVLENTFWTLGKGDNINFLND